MKAVLLNIPDVITTDRLIIRTPKPGDGNELNKAIIESFDELHNWMPWAATRPTVEESEENIRRACANWILREDLRYLLFDKTNGQLVGSSGLHRINWLIPSFEIGYWVRKSFSGKGLVTESTCALTFFAFEELRARRVELRCRHDNERSLKIIKKLGFEFEGQLRNTGIHKDQLNDTLVFSRLNANGLPDLNINW